MRAVLYTAMALMLVTGGWSWAKEPTESNPAAKAGETKSFNFWMDAKLKESQTVFAALSRADFDAIIESTETLQALNKVESFVRRRTPEYATQLRTFRFAVDEIQRQARKENIEGVVLGFNQLTLSCVNCHKHLRDATP